MNQENDYMDVTILIADDDIGYVDLVRRNFKRAGLSNKCLHFGDGQEILDFLFMSSKDPVWNPDMPHILLLDIRMPKVDGIQVLQKIKSDPKLRSLPVIMLTTTDNPYEIKHCYDLGCSCYITKPVDYQEFVNVVRQLGLFMKIISLPILGSTKSKESVAQEG